MSSSRLQRGIVSKQVKDMNILGSRRMRTARGHRNNVAIYGQRAKGANGQWKACDGRVLWERRPQMEEAELG